VIIPRLSVYIAMYIHAYLIDQTLDSIISQTRDEVDIVVSDGACRKRLPLLRGRSKLFKKCLMAMDMQTQPFYK
jgi:hypothetical protein